VTRFTKQFCGCCETCACCETAVTPRRNTAPVQHGECLGSSSKHKQRSHGANLDPIKSCSLKAHSQQIGRGGAHRMWLKSGSVRMTSQAPVPCFKTPALSALSSALFQTRYSRIFTIYFLVLMIFQHAIKFDRRPSLDGATFADKAIQHRVTIRRFYAAQQGTDLNQIKTIRYCRKISTVGAFCALRIDTDCQLVSVKVHRQLSVVRKRSSATVLCSSMVI
jgi:uncharacterized protein (DUF1684 family)